LDVLTLVDSSRPTPPGGGLAGASERTLVTHLYLPDGDERGPLVVFAHGYHGHPRKFTRLLGGWRDAGYAVAAPTFPLSSDVVPEPTFDDIPQQPRDLSFVLDALLASHGARLDAERVAFAGFSMGAATVLDAAFAPGADERARAVIAIGGGLGNVRGHVFTAIPLLVTHATEDYVVPYERGAAAFALARPPKAMLTFETPTHHEGVQDDPRPEVARVLDATTLAFLDWALRGDDSGVGRLRAAVEAAPVARLDEVGLPPPPPGRCPTGGGRDASAP
jgi:predicted dienelactone hydrolase